MIDYVKSQHSLKAKAETFVNGTVIDDWDTEHLFKILFVAADGDAIMWNFDERLYKVSRYDESKNCFKTNDLAIVVNSKTLSEGKRITQISLVKK